LKQKNQFLQLLFERKFISENQLHSIKSYESLGIFSIRQELLLLLYIGVLCFTSGIGIILYRNIDSIGHIVLLIIILLSAFGCYWLSFIKAPDFSLNETKFLNPLFDYVVLAGSLLVCIFFGYLQTRFDTLGDDYSIAAFIAAAITMAAAYYFDNKSSYAIGISAFATFLGIVVTPQTVIKNQIYLHYWQTVAGLGLSLILALWYEYATRHSIKKHFGMTSIFFALHLTGLSCLKGLFEDMWLVYVALLAAAVYYFYLKSHELAATGLFVFTMLYAYLGVNIFILKLLDIIHIPFAEVINFLSPFYLIFSIWLFIKLTKRFNRQTDDGEA
jgi:hypothetical protein